MTHANRSKRSDNPARNPTPDEIRQAREKWGLSPADAARLCFNTGQWWEDCEAGTKRMHPAIWRFWRLSASDELPATFAAARQYIGGTLPLITGEAYHQSAQAALDGMDRVEDLLRK